MSTPEPEIARAWYNASKNDGSSCVETQFYADGSVDVRSTENPDGGTAHFTNTEWAAFTKGVKANHFEPLL